MKKIIIIISIIIFVYIINDEEYNIVDNSIRFRVISNSNSMEDIKMKEKVVQELSSTLFQNNTSHIQTEENIYSNLNIIENKINNLFQKYDYNKNFNITYGLNEFPEKKYRGNIYPAGKYNSLVIEIGDAKGDNYFCFLYPSLCLLDYNEEKEEKQYGFKIIDIFNSFK